MSHNTLMHRLVRPAIRPLARASVTPNQVTTMRLVAGLAAAAAFALGDSSWPYWGAGLFVLSMFLDRMDGELARATGKSTPWGHRYDLISDGAVNALAFVGLGVGLRDGGLGAWAIALGLVAGGAVAAVIALVARVEDREGARAAELRGVPGFDPDDAMLVVPLAVVLDGGAPLLVAAGIGAPLFAAAMFRRWLPRLREGARGATSGRDV